MVEIISLLNNLRHKKQVLQIADLSLCFSSLQDFEFSIAARTSIPSGRVLGLMNLSPKKLMDESIAIKKVEKRLLTILSREMDKGNNLGSRLRELRPSTFTHDNQWHDIFSVLRVHNEELEEYRHVALIKYVQYLAARQEIIRGLYKEKSKVEKSRQRQATSRTQGSKEPVGINTLMAIRQSPTSAQKEKSRKKRYEQIQRLPKGETVCLRIGDKERVDIFLAKYKCQIVGGTPTLFYDQASNKHVLTTGRTTIGRDISCNIIMDSGLREISRLHLIISIDSQQQAYATDMSSHGTLVQAKHLKAAAVRTRQ